MKKYKYNFLVMFSLIMITPLFGEDTAFSNEVDEEEIFAYIGNLPSLYERHGEYRIEIEFESVNRLQFDSEPSASYGHKTVINDGERFSIQSAYVNRDSLSAARDGYLSEQARRIRNKEVVTPFATYIQSLHDYGGGEVQRLSRGSSQPRMAPFRPLTRLKELVEAISLSMVEGTMEETEEGVVCTFINTDVFGHERGELSAHVYTLLKFDSFDAQFPDYIEIGVCRPSDFENRGVHETLDIVVSEESPLGYSEYIFEYHVPRVENGVVGERYVRRYEKVRIVSWEEYDPLPEDFRFLVKRGTEVVVYNDNFSEPVAVEVDKEVVIEAQ